MTNASTPTPLADELTLEVAAKRCRYCLIADIYGAVQAAVLRFTKLVRNTGQIVAKLHAAISCTHLKYICQVVA